MFAHLSRRARCSLCGRSLYPAPLLHSLCHAHRTRAQRRAQHFIYEDELLDWTRRGILTELHTAFSRDDPRKRVYVQDLLRENGAAVWSTIEKRGGVVFVCGGTQMGHAIHDALVAIATEEGGLSDADATAYVAHLVDTKRYYSELWS